MAQIEPPPNIIEKFNYIWKEWLNNLWQFIQDHTGGSSTGGTGTGSNWNAHGNIALGNATNPLKVEEGTFWVDGNSTTGNNPWPGGAGRGLLFIPSSAAFRVGAVTGTQWDTIGDFSVGIGRNCNSPGTGTVAIGDNIDIQSVAAGVTGVGRTQTINSLLGNSVTVGALCNNINLFNTTVVGISSQVTGTVGFATVVGYNSQASSSNTVALGNTSVASGGSSAAIGQWVTASQAQSVVIGTGISGNSLISPKANSLVLGVNSDTPTLILDGKGGGVGTTGFIGIIEQNPLSTLDVGGSVGFQYTNVTGQDAGTTNITGNEYTFRVDTSGMTGSNTHIMQLPQLGASTIDRRIYYFKATNISATAHSATVTITPNAADQIEDFTAGVGQLLGAGVGLVISPGTAITIIGNNSDGAWWVI